MKKLHQALCMFSGKSRMLFSVVSLIFGIAISNAQQESRNLFYDAAYVRPVSGKTWSVQITGTVSSLPGCYILVHDAEGNRLAMEHVPHGEYTEDKPFIIEIPADKAKGECRIVIVGNQSDILGVALPMTSAPKEVYGSDSGLFATRNKPSVPLWFKQPSNIEKADFSGTNGPLRLLDGEAAILTTEAVKTGAYPGVNTKGSTALEGGKVYQLDVSKTFYFQIKPSVFLAFDQEHVFYPDAKLLAIPWWQLTGSNPHPDLEAEKKLRSRISQSPNVD